MKNAENAIKKKKIGNFLAALINLLGENILRKIVVNVDINKKKEENQIDMQHK